MVDRGVRRGRVAGDRARELADGRVGPEEGVGGFGAPALPERHVHGRVGQRRAQTGLAGGRVDRAVRAGRHELGRGGLRDQRLDRVGLAGLQPIGDPDGVTEDGRRPLERPADALGAPGCEDELGARGGQGHALGEAVAEVLGGVAALDDAVLHEQRPRGPSPAPRAGEGDPVELVEAHRPQRQGARGVDREGDPRLVRPVQDPVALPEVQGGPRAVAAADLPVLPRPPGVARLRRTGAEARGERHRHPAEHQRAAQPPEGPIGAPALPGGEGEDGGQGGQREGAGGRGLGGGLHGPAVGEAHAHRHQTGHRPAPHQDLPGRRGSERHQAHVEQRHQLGALGGRHRKARVAPLPQALGHDLPGRRPGVSVQEEEVPRRSPQRQPEGEGQGQDARQSARRTRHARRQGGDRGEGGHQAESEQVAHPGVGDEPRPRRRQDQDRQGGAQEGPGDGPLRP